MRFAWLLAAFSVLATAPRLLLHELWRDEAWLWLVVTESRSLPDLVAALGRTGQGYLFPVLCFLARQLSTAPQAMQLVNLVMVGAGAYVLARWAPFRPAERALLALGYYPFYEYAVLSRHYAVGVLLVWVACAAACSRRPAIGLGVAIALLCQTTVYGYIIALAIAAGFFLDRWRHRHERVPVSPRAAVAGIALAVVGSVAGLLQLVPEPGTSFAVGWRFGREPARAIETLQMPWHAFVPLPRPEPQFWNSDLLAPWPGWRAVAGLAVLAVASAILWPRKLALATFGLGGLGLLAFGYIKYVGTLRHHGHLWILFVAPLWLAGGPGRQHGRRSRRELLLLTLLVLHCAAAVFASWMDLRYPFSNSVQTAELIRRQGLELYPLLGYREPPAAPVALALGRPLYAPSRGIYATHTDWGPLQRDLTLEELRCAARELARREGQDVVLVMNQELPTWPEIGAAGSRVGAIVKTEDYYLYRLSHGALASTSRDAACAGEAQ